MIASDPPDHTMLRRIVSRPFTKRRIAEWDEMARRLAATLVDELIDRIRSDGDADFTTALAIPHADRGAALRTPYKLGKLVLGGSQVPGTFDEKAVDCPFVFSHDGRFRYRC
jgi:hypothetical protein